MSGPINSAMNGDLFGISAVTARDLRQVFERTPGIDRVWIFGSRARGTARDVSDIDLAVDAPAIAEADFQALHRRLLDLPTLYKLDVVHWQAVTEPVFVDEINRDRRVFWQPVRRSVNAQSLAGITPKKFQSEVLAKLAEYLTELRRQRAQTEAQASALQAMEGAEDTLRALADYPRRAWDALRKAGALPQPLKGQSLQHSSRFDGAGRAIPNVCLKVPTGGGKTLLAAAAIGQLMQGWLARDTGLVLWVVPNEAIYRQTLAALSHRDHPYRQMLNVAAAGRVKVLEKTAPLTRQDVETQLCVMVLMLQSASRASKETLKFFRDRGNVLHFLPPEDDIAAHWALLQQVPKLDAYRDRGHSAEEARAQMGSIVKSSLGNVMRLVRPLVVIDEGHHAYSETALNTIDGFNPSFMLELSATPRLASAKAGNSGSNVLVNVRGVDLDEAEMIKLPIEVDVRGWADWQACLASALQQLDELQREAETLHAQTARYVRPIMLVQVERTGADTRDAGFIHAEDAREHLLRLGLNERQVAVKTSDRNDLKAPENIDLMSPACDVRVIITKQALQEGWDCPFAYVLCALAAGRNLAAMTQLVGRVLRLPQVAKTGHALLDACYVLCHGAGTGAVVGAIKKSLEDEGMGDLGVNVRSGKPDPAAPRPVVLQRRSAWYGVRLFFPTVTWAESGAPRRSLVYESDVLSRVPWQDIDASNWLSDWAPDATRSRAGRLSLGLELLSGAAPAASVVDIGEGQLDRGRIVRAISDLVPNAWLAWNWLGQVQASLLRRGFAESTLAASSASLIEALRIVVDSERDRHAETVFSALLEAGRIEFRLRADRLDYELPQDMTLQISGPAQLWTRDADASAMQRSLFEPALRAPDINEFEHKVAGYLDEQQAVRWWHRNVAKTQIGLQGWKRGKVYPDFVFATQGSQHGQQLVLLETKGLHLKGDDTAYKQALLQRLTTAFRDERGQKVGSLELESGSHDAVVCDLVFDGAWRGALAAHFFNAASASNESDLAKTRSKGL